MIKTVILSPSRIGCPSIPGTMKGMIMSIRGVKEVGVKYEERSLEVTFDDAETSEDEITKKIGEEMGLAMKAEGDRDDGVAGTCPM